MFDERMVKCEACGATVYLADVLPCGEEGEEVCPVCFALDQFTNLF